MGKAHECLAVDNTIKTEVYLYRVLPKTLDWKKTISFVILLGSWF